MLVVAWGISPGRYGSPSSLCHSDRRLICTSLGCLLVSRSGAASGLGSRCPGLGLRTTLVLRSTNSSSLSSTLACLGARNAPLAISLGLPLRMLRECLLTIGSSCGSRGIRGERLGLPRPRATCGTGWSSSSTPCCVRRFMTMRRNVDPSLFHSSLV